MRAQRRTQLRLIVRRLPDGLDQRERMFRHLGVPSQNEHPGETEAQRWLGLEHSIRQRRQPARPVKIVSIHLLIDHERDDYAQRIGPGLRAQRIIERLTNQIADALDTVLKPTAVGVIIRASHACMSSRGVKIHGSVTTTSALRGAALTEVATRAEFLQHCEAGERHHG